MKKVCICFHLTKSYTWSNIFQIESKAVRDFIVIENLYQYRTLKKLSLFRSNCLLSSFCYCNHIRPHLSKQLFQTWLPRHTRVPQRGVGGATKFWKTVIDVLLHTMPQIVIFYQVRVTPNLLRDLKGDVNRKTLKNTGSKWSHWTVLMFGTWNVLLSFLQCSRLFWKKREKSCWNHEWNEGGHKKKKKNDVS